jgi:hypothetical protein
MSGLTGYLTIDGYDLSLIYQSKQNANFSNIITTNLGIIGPSASITYTDTMIGYVNPVSTQLGTSVNISSGFTQLTNGFTFQSLGMYLCFAYAFNVYSSSSAGNFTEFSLGISTSTTSSVGGFFETISPPRNLPTTGLQFISGHTFFPFQVTSTSQTYYMIQKLIFTGITVKSYGTLFSICSYCIMNYKIES